MKTFTFTCLLLCSVSSFAQELPDMANKALKNDSPKLVTDLINNNIDQCYSNGRKAYNLLTLSVKANATKLFATLISKNADINASCNKKSPLMYTVKYERFEMFKQLLNEGANIDVPSKYRSLAYYAKRGKRIKFADYLEKNYATKEVKLRGVDGPYLIDNTLYTVNEKGQLSSAPFTDQLIRVNVDNKDKDFFNLTIKSQDAVEKDQYQEPEKLITLSDIEGNFNAFYSFLLSNNIMDKDYNWIFGKGHLVLNGDFFDRGTNVMPVLWLIYALEQKAQIAGGKVHFILGNHEIMNMLGKGKYAEPKYVKAAQLISNKKEEGEALRYVVSKNSTIGRWLRTKNIIEKIGDQLFVHGGMSMDMVNSGLSIQEINQFFRSNIDNLSAITNAEQKQKAKLIFGRTGPLWYRGLISDYKKYYTKITESELNTILNFYQIKSQVLGHTPVKNISTDYDGKIIRVDVHHGLLKYQDETAGYLLEQGVSYRIDANGGKELLDH